MPHVAVTGAPRACLPANMLLPGESAAMGNLGNPKGKNAALVLRIRFKGSWPGDCADGGWPKAPTRCELLVMNANAVVR